MLKNEVYHGVVGQVDGLHWWAKSFGDNSEGSPAQVAFNYQRIYERDITKGDVIGFYHTHPNTMACPSVTDYATMGAWTVCFGRPLLCMIEGVDGLKAHWFIDDEKKHLTSTVSRIGDIFVGNLPDWGEKYNELLNRKFIPPEIEQLEIEFDMPELKGIDWSNDNLFYDHTYPEETSMFDTTPGKRWCPGMDCYEIDITVRMPIAFRDNEELQEKFIEWMYDRYPDNGDFWCISKHDQRDWMEDLVEGVE